MIELIPNLHIGTTDEVDFTRDDWRYINVAHTFHYTLHDWQLRDKNHDRTKDKCYVVCEELPHLLSVNWVDANEAKYFDYEGQGVKIFHKMFDFIDKARNENKNLLIVCNKGQSRSPSVGMAYLAKRTNYLSVPKIEPPEGVVYPFLGLKEEDLERPPYGIARDKFDRFFKEYYPGQGITQFLIENWHLL